METAAAARKKHDLTLGSVGFDPWLRPVELCLVAAGAAEDRNGEGLGGEGVGGVVWSVHGQQQKPPGVQNLTLSVAPPAGVDGRAERRSLCPPPAKSRHLAWLRSWQLRGAKRPAV